MVNQWKSTLNNWYTQITVTPVDCHKYFLAKSAGAVEDTDRISVEGLDFLNECPGYDTKQSDGEVPVMRSTPSLPSLPGPLCGLNRTNLCTYAKLNYLK